MKVFFKDVINDKITRLGFMCAFGIVLISLVFVLFYYNRLPPFIPIFNQLPWGEQRLGGTLTIFIPASIALLILIINLIISELVYKKIPLVSRMLAVTSLLISILTFLFVFKTILLIL